jgi:hypothetical protein
MTVITKRPWTNFKVQICSITRSKPNRIHLGCIEEDINYGIVPFSVLETIAMCLKNYPSEAPNQFYFLFHFDFFFIFTDNYLAFLSS